MKRGFTLFLFTSLANILSAQFTTPTVNGSIGTNEYGVHTNGNNQETNTITWYMTWDNTNLYIGIGSTSNNSSESAVVYLDVNPISPINGGTNSDGSTTGYNNYDRSTYNPAFRADMVIYFKSGYYEYRTANGTGGWGSQTVSGLTYAQSGIGAGHSQEIAIPWSTVPGGVRPTSFNWACQKIYDGGVSNNGIYGQLPSGNPGGVQNQTSYTINAIRYYTVSSTADASSTKPFSRESYVFNGTSDISGFGTISVYDFTMNTSTRTITRGSGAWTISGNLVVNNGTLSFGSTADACSVTGNSTIGSGGTLTLSSTVGGDINIGGNFTNNGTFNSSGRAVAFNGTSAQNLSGSGSITIDYLTMNNSAGLTLSRAVTVSNNITFSNGSITLGSNNLTVNSGATFTTPSSLKYIVTDGIGTLIQNNITTSTLLPVGPAGSYNPVTIANGGGSNYSVKVSTTAPSGSGITQPTKVISRQWDITPSGTPSSVSLTFQYNSGEGVSGGTFSPTGSMDGIHYNSGMSKWEYVSTATASGSNPYTVAFTYAGPTWSPFSFGNAGVLSVELSNITANKLDGKNDLQWVTSSEKNNAHFNIQRSPNNQTWQTIGQVKATNNPNGAKYNFVDNAPLSNINYYRLQMVDIDGKMTYSKVVSVSADGGKKTLSVYPNPVKSELNLVTDGNTEGVSIYDMTGRAVRQYNDNRTKVNVADLPNGLYFVRLLDKNGLAGEPVRFVKQ